jgi:hypothetical protein
VKQNPKDFEEDPSTSQIITRLTSGHSYGFAFTVRLVDSYRASDTEDVVLDVLGADRATPP